MSPSQAEDEDEEEEEEEGETTLYFDAEEGTLRAANGQEITIDMGEDETEDGEEDNEEEEDGTEEQGAQTPQAAASRPQTITSTSPSSPPSGRRRMRLFRSLPGSHVSLLLF